MQSMIIPEVANIYNQRAEFRVDGTTNKAETAAAVETIDAFRIAKEARILDVGCGEGWVLKALSNAGYQNLYGIDISSETLKLAAQKMGDGSIALILGDVSLQSAPLFELITAFNSSIGSFGSAGDESYLQGIASSLKLNGRLIITFIDLKAANKRVGNFRTEYNKQNPLEVISSVALSKDNQCLIIDQTCFGRDLQREKIRIIERAQMEKMMQRVGLQIIPNPLHADEEKLFPYVAVACARRV